MGKRWTMKELEEMSDRQFVISILQERKAGLNNLAPLSRRINGVIKKLEKGEALTWNPKDIH